MSQIESFKKSPPSYHFRKTIPLLFVPVVLACLNTSCAIFRSKADSEDVEAMKNQLSEMRVLVGSLAARIETFETRVNSMSDRVSSSSGASTGTGGAGVPHLEPVTPHPSDHSGKPPAVNLSTLDPEGAFVNDEAIQDYRKGMLQFQAGQYSECILSFSHFLEKYPDHTLAGNAQYHIGRSHFIKRNFKLAHQEYFKVLTSYDRSSHIAATLRDLALVEKEIKHTEDSNRHFQQLASFFPHSPEYLKEEIEAPAVEVQKPESLENTPSHPALDGPPPTAPGPVTKEAAPSHPTAEAPIVNHSEADAASSYKALATTLNSDLEKSENPAHNVDPPPTAHENESKSAHKQ